MGKRHVEVRLRPFTAEHIPHKIAWVHDPKINRFLHFELPLTEAQILDWLERRDAEDRHDLVMETLEGRPIGTLGIENLSWQHRRGEAYICIGEPEFWGTTAGQHGTRQLLDYAFLQLGLNRLFIMTENLAAVGHYLKAGLRIEGTLRHFYIRDGVPQDGLIMGTVAQDYLVQRSKMVRSDGGADADFQLYMDVLQAYAFPAQGRNASSEAVVDRAELESDGALRAPLAMLRRARRERRRGRCGELAMVPTGHRAWEPLLSALTAAAPDLESEHGSGELEPVENLCRLAEQSDVSASLTPALWQAVYRALHTALTRRTLVLV